MTGTQLPLPDSYEGLLAQARGAFRAGDLESALALYRRLVARLSRLGDRIWARRPDLRRLYLEAARECSEALAVAGRFAEGIQVLEPLLASHPEESIDIRQRIAVLRNSRGNPEEGLAELQSVAELHPDDATNWILLGAEATIEGHFSKAEMALDRGLQVAKQAGQTDLVPQVQLHRFRLFKEMGRVDEALAAWDQAIAAYPQAFASITEVYALLIRAGRYTQALAYAARDDNPLRAGFQRGLVAYLTGQTAEARREWQAVADRDPSQFESGWDFWAESALRLGEGPDRALEHLEKLLARFASPRLLTLAGIAWAVRGDGELAAILFQQVINVTRRSRERKARLDSEDWRLLDSLVADSELKKRLKPYFAVVDTVWGQPDLDTQVWRPPR